MKGTNYQSYGRAHCGLLIHGGLLEDFIEEKGFELVLGTWVGFGWVERIVTVLIYQVLTVYRLWDKGS